MIWQPKIGQRVRVHYRMSAQKSMVHQGMYGKVMAVSKGPGPRNVMVFFGHFVMRPREIIPRGNLVAIMTA